MTKNFVDKLKVASPDTTYQDLIAKIRHGASEKSHQILQLEGNVYLPLFGEQSVDLLLSSKQESLDYSIAIEAVTANAVQLSTGAIHGVTVGSVYALYPVKESRRQNPHGKIHITYSGTIYLDCNGR